MKKSPAFVRNLGTGDGYEGEEIGEAGCDDGRGDPAVGPCRFYTEGDWIELVLSARVTALMAIIGG